LFATVAKIPTFSWLDTISAIANVSTLLEAADAQSNGKPIVAEFVIYDLPGRDCAAEASNGEIPAGGIATYKTDYIDVAYAALSKKSENVHLVLVIEPDSLPNLATNIGTLKCDSTTQTEYPEGVAYAIAKLSSLPNTWLYLDAGHGGWLGWPDNQQKIVPIFQNVITLAKGINSKATVTGFASTTANYDPFNGGGACPAQQYCPLVQDMYDYNPCIDENLYTTALNAVFSPANLPTRWLVDTSRGGRTNIREYWGSWCNVKGAGLGAVPTTAPATQVDAFVWVKPPGDSDGVSGPAGAPRLDGHCDPTNTAVSLGASGSDSLSGAPQAGQWFQDQFIMLVDNANPPITPSAVTGGGGGGKSSKKTTKKTTKKHKTTKKPKKPKKTTKKKSSKK
jgi:cellulose 1,4-beta-cellobiosidase